MDATRDEVAAALSGDVVQVETLEVGVGVPTLRALACMANQLNWPLAAWFRDASRRLQRRNGVAVPLPGRR